MKIFLENWWKVLLGLSMFLGVGVTVAGAEDCNMVTYSDWSSCSVDGQQTRAIISLLPDKCVPGNLVLNKSCGLIDSTPIIYSVSPKVVTPGDTITINGNNFGKEQLTSFVVMGGYTGMGKIISWSNTEIAYQTSVKWDNYSEAVGIKKCPAFNSCFPKVDGPFFYIQPKIVSINVSSGAPGDVVKISGNYLKNNNIATNGFYNVSVYFGGVKAIFPKDGVWTENEIEAVVPQDAIDGNITLEITADGSGDSVVAIGPRFHVLSVISSDTYSGYQKYFKTFNLPEAWGFAKNRKEIVVAVIDDGVYSGHPDLKNQMWLNEVETVGDGRDDDGNGYVDDRSGWNFISNSNSLLPLGPHGTMAAGIIAAQTNNGLGIAGVNDKVKIMPLIVCDGVGKCLTDNVIKAIKYAVDNHAEVIYLNLGVKNDFGYTGTYNEVLEHAHNQNVLVVTAVGNSDVNGGKGIDLNSSPMSPVCNDGSSNNVIGVGAVANSNYIADWSNYGYCVDIYAPGENILSTAVSKYATLGGGYDIKSGTSYSSAIVAGAVSLLKASYPTLSADQLINYLKNNSNNGVLDAAKVLATDGLTLGHKISVINSLAAIEALRPGGKVLGVKIIKVTPVQKVITQESRLEVKNDLLTAKRLSGNILLQVEKNGEAWYVSPLNLKRYYLADGGEGYKILRVMGIGITDSNLQKLKTDKNFAKKNSGKIFLQVESKGEAWYVSPKDNQPYYLKDGNAAYQIMRIFGQGITDTNLRKIEVGSL